jgi:hypothetical protein
MTYRARVALGIAACALIAGCGVLRQAQDYTQLPMAPVTVQQSTSTSSRVPGGHEHFIEALFYAFGDGELAIFNVSIRAKPKLRELVSIPHGHFVLMELPRGSTTVKPITIERRSSSGPRNARVRSEY